MVVLFLTRRAQDPTQGFGIRFCSARWSVPSHPDKEETFSDVHY